MSNKWKEFMAELQAIGREAIHDVRQTLNEVYSGKGEHAPEPGTPLHPLQREIYETKHQPEAEKKDLEMDL